MANEVRRRTNNVQGQLSASITSTSTTMTSAGLVNLEAISSTEHAAINIDPGRSAGAPEIVYVTAHTAASTSANILRSQEGTAARAHSTGVTWLHAPTAAVDFQSALVFAEATTSQTGITSETDLTGLTVTSTLATARRVRLSAHARIDASTDAARCIFRIKEGTDTLTIGRHTYAPGTESATLSPFVVLEPSTGAHTYKLTLQGVDGTVDLNASTDEPAQILLEDMGSA